MEQFTVDDRSGYFTTRAFPFSSAEIRQMVEMLIARGMPTEDVDGARFLIIDPSVLARQTRYHGQYIKSELGLIKLFTLKKKDTKLRGRLYFYENAWKTKDEIAITYPWIIAHEIGHYVDHKVRRRVFAAGYEAEAIADSYANRYAPHVFIEEGDVAEFDIRPIGIDKFLEDIVFTVSSEE